MIQTLRRPGRIPEEVQKSADQVLVVEEVLSGVILAALQPRMLWLLSVSRIGLMPVITDDPSPLNYGIPYGSTHPLIYLHVMPSKIVDFLFLVLQSEQLFCC